MSNAPSMRPSPVASRRAVLLLCAISATATGVRSPGGGPPRLRPFLGHLRCRDAGALESGRLNHLGVSSATSAVAWLTGGTDIGGGIRAVSRDRHQVINGRRLGVKSTTA